MSVLVFSFLCITCAFLISGAPPLLASLQCVWGLFLWYESCYLGDQDDGCSVVSRFPGSWVTTPMAGGGGRCGHSRFVSLPYCSLVPYVCLHCCAVAWMLKTCLLCCSQALWWYEHHHSPWEGAGFFGIDAADAPLTFCQAVVWGPPYPNSSTTTIFAEDVGSL